MTLHSYVTSHPAAGVKLSCEEVLLVRDRAVLLHCALPYTQEPARFLPTAGFGLTPCASRFSQFDRTEHAAPRF